MSQPRTRHAIRNRLIISMAATVALGLLMTAIVFVVSIVTIRSLTDRSAAISAIDEASQTLQISLLTQETALFDYTLSGRATAVEEFDAASTAETEAFATFRALAADDSELLASLETARVAVSAWRTKFAEPLLRAGASGARLGPATVEGSAALFQPASDALLALDQKLTIESAETAAQIDAAIPNLATTIIALGVVTTILLAILGLWLVRSVSGPLRRLNKTVEALVAGEPVTFRAERDDELGALADALERLRSDAGQRYEIARNEAEHAATFNQLAELTSFAGDERELVEAAARAIRRLVATDSGDILLANPSQNRLTVGVAWGDRARVPGELVPLDRIDRCPGIRRSSAFLVGDAGDDMSVHCPAHPAATGTYACVPMLALGKVVGVVHLESPVVNAFDSDGLALVTRVAESVGLAMANARLMKSMEGLAMTDPLTGLRNARFFDPYLEQELEAARRDEQPLSVVMIDIDHFKTFNDTHGHPAGDEALRTFARVVGGAIRSSDVAARYGGEEFIVALRHAGIQEANALAERIRIAVEQAIVELGPGRYARITASFGVASTEMNVHDQKSLVSLADAALYRAKEAGRNRVELAPSAKDVVVLHAASRRRLGKAAATSLGNAEQTSG